MHPLYLLESPTEPAAPPTRWSWSALTVWRQCPRRWWLLTSHYGRLGGRRYPTPASQAALRGDLVHAALEEWWRLRRMAEAQPVRFDAYSFIKQKFHEVLEEWASNNPRVERDRLAAAFSLDRCAADFYAIVRQLSAVPPASLYPVAGEKTADGTGFPVLAEEYPIEVDDPPLQGRIDQVRHGVLVDFKTGDPDAEQAKKHERQLGFYAVLWWLRFGRPPTGLELRYPTQTRSLPAPAVGDLATEAARLRQELQEANRMLTQPPPEANPDAEVCAWCPVRQLCPEFWTATQTTALRLLDPGMAERVAVFRDVRLTRLPAGWAPGRPLIGNAWAADLGEVEIMIPASQCPTVDMPDPIGARILGAVLTRGTTNWTLRTGAASEVFWQPADEASLPSA